MLLFLLSLVAGLSSALAGTLRVDVLDIGQGDAILIRTPAEKTILIDAGDGKVGVPALLTGLGVKGIDLVVATHPHADHIGGMDDVLDSFPIRNYIDNGLPHSTKTYADVMSRVEAKEIPYRAAVRDTKYNLDDGVVLEVLFPDGTKLANTRSDLNSNSVVTRLTHGENCFLFVGDSEEPTERALLDKGLEPCDVLKVAHHGSRHSTTAPFLAALKPSIAVISLGAENRYGHPGEETLRRLRPVVGTLYRTDLQGRVTFFSDKAEITVETERKAPSPEALWVGATKKGRSKDADGTADSAESAQGARAAGAAAPSAATATAGGAIDLNRADAATLETLPGIGPSKAAAIVQYRTEHGPFKSVDELEAVPGIGPKTIAALRSQATVGGAASSPATP